MRVAMVSVNQTLLGEGHGDDEMVLRALGERVAAVTAVVATARDVPERKLAPNVTVLPVSHRGRLGGVRALSRALARLHAAHGLDVIQAQEPFFTGIASLVAARRSGAALVVGVFGADPYDPMFTGAGPAHRAAAPVGRLVLRRASAVQVDCTVTEERLSARGLPARFKPMTPLDLRTFLERRGERVFRDPATSVLFVGRLGRQKRVDVLVDAFGRLRAEMPSVTLTVVGDGPDKGAVAHQVRAAGLENAVRFQGSLPRSQLADTYLQADVLALSSAYEGMPRVFLEAGATGLPIVSTRVTGALELAAHAPVTLAGRDPEDLAAALARTLADRDGRKAAGDALGLHIETRAQDRPPYERQVELWEEVAS